MDTLHVGNTTREILLKYPAFASAANLRSWYMNGDGMVIQPDRGVFDELYGRWMRGDFPYSGHKAWFHDQPPFGDANKSVVAGGEDNQHVLFRMLFNARGQPNGTQVVRGNGTEKVHIMDVCDNNKEGKRAHCPQSRYTMYHKMPEWEASRMHLLYLAALNGQCRNNPALLNWEA